MQMKKPVPTYYDILGVPNGADAKEIREAFKSEVLKFRDQPGGGEQTRRINLAYRALNDPERRRDYDDRLAGVGTAGKAGAATLPASSAVTADEPSELPSPSSPPPDSGRKDRRDRGKGPAMFLMGALGAGVVGIGLLSLGLPQTGSGNPESNGPTLEGASSLPPAASTAVPPRSANSPDEQYYDGRPPIGSDSPAETSAQASLPAGQPATDTPGRQTAPTSSAGAAVASPAPPPATMAARNDTVPPDPVRRTQTDEPTPDRSAPARFLSGGLLDSDNRGGRFEGSVGVRIAVSASGRPSGCRVTRSSGNTALDSTTCRLLEERLIFEPARDRSGAVMPSVVESTHVWGRRRR